LSTGNALLLALMLATGANAKAVDNNCLAYVAKRESENQPLRAVRGVVEVVQHRMKKAHKSCKAVVSQRGQFSWWRKNVKMKVEPEWLTRYNESRKMRSVLPACAEFFHSTDAQPSWARKMKKVAKFGKIVYYCDV
jgi:spore germination cell wall hydrolase CwlJ-like protein